jgi:ribose/xylose/arabinose/galactoside ABC-type transport system permease subunit
VGKVEKVEKAKKWNIDGIVPLKKISERRELGVVIPLIVFFMIFALRSPNFYSSDNIMNILRNASYTLIGAVGMTLLLITGIFDLSAGSQLAFGGVITGFALIAGIDIPLAILIGIAATSLGGVLMGISTVILKIPCFIGGMGVMYILKGVVLLATGGMPVFPLPENFSALTNYQVGPLPLVLVVAAVMSIIAHIVLKYTVFGRKIFACGGNVETSRLAGIRTNRILFVVHIISACCMGIAGVLTAARLGSGQPTAGADYNMTIIAACVIGGVSLFGGAGSILGAVFGSIFMTMLTNGMTITGISPFYQQLILGIVVIVSVAFDRFRTARKM